MRTGQNPAKKIEKVAQPREITVCIVNFIPMLEGFHAQGMEVLRACLESVRANTEQPFDLVVFDNHSCPEVRDYLVDMLKQDQIQYLILSDTNIGKIGAWNFMFGAAQGKYVAFADGDIYFRPGWLKSTLEIFAAYPQAGMITAIPLRTKEEMFTSTLDWGRQQGVLQEGAFLEWEVFLEHAVNTGWDEAKAREKYLHGKDYLLEYNGRRAYVGAAHFQFVCPRPALQQILPLPSEKPMRGENILDSRLNELGYLRLSTTEAYVAHMGNEVKDRPHAVRAVPRMHWLRRLLWLPGIRHLLFGIYNGLFRLYFSNVK
ncbi:MAG: glycosyltransferase [Anaerolineales bacterium]|nr:glycosyltransferase [Anaerolineales bacterium]